MKINNREMMTNRQFLFIVLFTNICVTPFVAPSLFFAHIGHGSYLPLIGIFLFTIGATYVAIKICEHFKEKNIVEWSRSLFGKWFGTLYGFAVIVIFYLWGYLMMYVFIELIIYTQLPQTSRMLLIFFILAVTVYMLRQGLSTFSRFVELFAPMTLLILVLINVPQFKNVSFQHFLPFETLPEYGMGYFHYQIVSQLFMFRAVFIIYFFYPFIEKRGKLFRFAILATTISVLQVFLSIILPLGIFGKDFVKRLSFPYQESLETVSITMLPLDRISILTSIIWQLIILYVLYVSFFATISGIRSIFRFESERWLTYSLLTLTFFLALYPFSKDFIIKMIVYWSFAGIFVFGIVPFFVWLYVRSKKG